MSKKKFFRMFVIAALLAGMMAMPVMAASKKYVKEVSITVEAKIIPESRVGTEDIEVKTQGAGYYYDDQYEIVNEGFTWKRDCTPQLIIYLRAEENYSFNKLEKVSQVKLKGATFASADGKSPISKEKEGSYYDVLKIRVNLTPLSEYVADFSENDTVTITDNGFATWNPILGAGSYEVMVYRDGNPVGVTARNTTETNFNLKNEITRAASYQVKVRPVNGENASNKGKWLQSNMVSYNADQVKAIRAGAAGGLPVSGEWKGDATGWWYQHSDGSYTKNAWEEIEGKWYMFDENGYMRTGWIDWNGKRYYCDDRTGAMLTNTTTPDGYIMDYDGTIKNN